MNSATPALSALLSIRADAILTMALTVAACFCCRRYVARRHPAQELSKAICLVAICSAVVGAGVAEWATSLVSALPTETHLQGIAALRALALGGTIAFVAALLAGWTIIGLQRGELRERAITERQLEQARASADEANRAKGDFLAVMSHEIRTPLNAVIGFANLLAESKLDEIQRGYLATVTSEGTRLSSLVNDILDLSKIEEGRLSLERLPFAPVETALEVLRLFRARAAEKNLDLRFEAQLTGQLLVAGDPLRFRQILVNLTDNAIKFTPRGSVTVFLTWTPPELAASHGRLGLRVKDTGIGIPVDKRKNLFQMFMQADVSTTRRYGGTGLGLAICQRLVALMGGEIIVNSTVGEGTEFAFTVPAAPVALPGELEADDSRSLFAPGRKPHILVVDDMQTNRFLLEVFLSRTGFESTLAAGGEEAVRLAGENRYDAILMDLQMPDLDGYGATQRIRAGESAGSHIPIIALTASIAKGTREKCLAAGMDEHLTKPLDLRKFNAVLRQIIAEKSDLNLTDPQTAAPRHLS
jgi:signal transduction histidine kinase/ActR/RegA family two-component response regulator